MTTVRYKEETYIWPNKIGLMQTRLSFLREIKWIIREEMPWPEYQCPNFGFGYHKRCQHHFSFKRRLRWILSTFSWQICERRKKEKSSSFIFWWRTKIKYDIGMEEIFFFWYWIWKIGFSLMSRKNIGEKSENIWHNILKSPKVLKKNQYLIGVSKKFIVFNQLYNFF